MRQLALLLLVACGGLAPKTEDTLDESVRVYNEGVRWARYEVAAKHVPPKQRSQFVDDWDERAKEPGANVPDLNSYREVLVRL